MYFSPLESKNFHESRCKGASLGAMVGAITDGGIAGAALTVQMATDAIAIPTAVASW